MLGLDPDEVLRIYMSGYESYVDVIEFEFVDGKRRRVADMDTGKIKTRRVGLVRDI